MILYKCDSTDITLVNLREVMSLIFIDLHSRTPIYEQIKEQILLNIKQGEYKPDEQLPSIRSLAGELNLNVNTVKRAFKELELNGIIYSVSGKGSYVSHNAKSNDILEKSIKKEVSDAVHSAKEIGLSENSILELVHNIYKEGKQYD